VPLVPVRAGAGGDGGRAGVGVPRLRREGAGGVSPQRIQRRRTRGWRMPEGAVCVGRPSRWGNPFWIANGHTLAGPPWGLARDSWTHLPLSRRDAAYITSSSPLGTAEAVSLFQTLMTVRQWYESERLREWLTPLVGRDLACWCPLNQPCHADVLLKIANEVPA
jgi:hypothetical protein